MSRANRRRNRRQPARTGTVRIDDLDAQGRGVGRDETGKVVFVSGALPNELVEFQTFKRLRSHDEAEALAVLEASPDRVEPRCAHFGYCGGCSLQHLDESVQIQSKQGMLQAALERIGGLRDFSIEPPIAANAWAYRRKARLGAKFVAAKERALVGFRERKMPYVADINSCEVLDPRAGQLIDPLRELVHALSIRDRIPQIEFAAGDSQAALLFRVLAEPAESDLEALEQFAQHHDIAVYLQPGGYDTVRPLWPASGCELEFRLDEFDLGLRFGIADFVQVNGPINRALVSAAVDALRIGPEDAVLDLFCGLGNFTLAIARRAKQVVGFELSEEMVRRGRSNAALNHVFNASFETVDLFQIDAARKSLDGDYDKMLIDPPRSGAREVVEQLCAPYPSRIVYVSCNPATLARDAGVLVTEHGYKLQSTRAVDMFPHTGHVESLSVFARD